MSVTADILLSWRRPARVARRLAAAGRREDRALAYLMIGCLLIFVAQWPRLSQMAQLPGAETSLVRLMAYELFAWLILWPLLFYALAALVHVVVRLFGGQGQMFDSRLALFWALLASVPGALLFGMTRGMLSHGPAVQLTGAVWVGGFIWIAAAAIRELHWGRHGT